MDQKIPFTSYDFWAYLSAGFLLLFVADYVAGTGLLSRDSWPIVQGVVALASAYAVGQLVASLSSLLIERLLVANLIGYPRDVLFGQPTAPAWVRAMMPAYFQALPSATQKAVLEKASSAGITGSGEALFWMAYANARATPAVMAKMDNFLNQYGFCRNIALVALIDSALLYWSYRYGNGPDVNLHFSWVALVLGIGMTFRYLKFFRHFSVELYTSFAHSKEASGGSKP